MAEANTFHLVIASFGETLFDGEVVSVTLPGTEGLFEIFAHHEALVTTLKAGKIFLKDQNNEKREFDIEGGVVECSVDHAVVML